MINLNEMAPVWQDHISVYLGWIRDLVVILGVGIGLHFYNAIGKIQKERLEKEKERNKYLEQFTSPVFSKELLIQRDALEAVVHTKQELEDQVRLLEGEKKKMAELNLQMLNNGIVIGAIEGSGALREVVDGITRHAAFVGADEVPVDVVLRKAAGEQKLLGNLVMSAKQGEPIKLPYTAQLISLARRERDSGAVGSGSRQGLAAVKRPGDKKN